MGKQDTMYINNLFLRKATLYNGNQFYNERKNELLLVV